jgi:hypothetical protein
MSHHEGAISTTSLTDVVFHSGNRYANASHGTKIWSLLIAANKPLFFSLTKGDGDGDGGEEQQVQLAASIVHAVTTVGGRFLVKDKISGLYYNVGATCAQDSTHFALGGSEPHYAETLEEIVRVKQLYQAQCDYFDPNDGDALGKKVNTFVTKELDRLFHQAQHVEQSTTLAAAASSLSSSSSHGNANETSPLGEENIKVAAAAAAEAFTSGGNEQQQQEEKDEPTNIKVSAQESCRDDEANNNHNEEATQKEEPQHENSSDSDTTNKMGEKHTLDDAIVQKEDDEDTAKRQRVDQE